MQGMVSDIQKFSLHDGPGIRTTIFLKGCTLHCQWCHNPEAISHHQVLMQARSKCIGCGACIAACPNGAMVRGENGIECLREKCGRCFRCAAVCPAKALVVAGEEMEVQAVVDCAMADRDYYLSSGGGITLSGGDPVAQPAFSLELLKAFRAEGIHTAMESALCAPAEVTDALAEQLDLLLFDIKLMDEAEHIRYTGVSNRQALENVKRIAQTGLPMVARTPLIPGITDTEANISAIAAWLHENAPQARYQLLNYNPMAEAKWENIGLPYLIGRLEPLSARRLDELAQIGCAQGVDCFWEQE